MARKVDSRLILSGELVAETPLSVCGMGGNVDADLALAVNGQGKFYLPGTSLAGPLRAWLCARAGKNAVASLWGYQDGDKGHASFVLVEDGWVLDKNNNPLDVGQAEIRDGVGIDRYSGAAADGAKYNRQILPRGSRINLKLTVELTKEMQSEVEPLLAELWRALKNGEIRFGASKTRGLGRVVLQEGQTRKQEFSSRAGLLNILKGAPAPLELKLPEKSQYPQSCLTFMIHWQPVGPLMVKAEADGIAVDMLPLVSAVDDKLTLTLPGSSIKGAFRNQAERIARTLKGWSANPDDDFHQQIEVDFIREVFGEAGKPKQEKDDTATWLPGLSALSVDDCYALPAYQVDANQWSKIEGATDEVGLRAALDATPLKTAQQAFHVAIDRWLGGAADNMLYTVLEPHGIAWEPIRLKLDLARLPEDKHDTVVDKRAAAVACTLLVLRDFVAGRIPLGFGTNRGMGAIEVTQIEVLPEPEKRETLASLTLNLKDHKLIIGDDTLRDDLNRKWKKWLEQSAENKEAACPTK